MVGQIINSGEHWAIGVGYISVPNDIERDVYLKDCYLNGRISLKLEDGSVINRVPISLDIIGFIDFPAKSSELGSAVVYVTEQKHKQPIVIARVPKSDELGDGREKNFQIRRKFSDKLISIDGDPINGVLSINVIGGDKVGEFKIAVDNDNDDCVMDIEVSGELKIKTTQTTEIINHQRFESRIQDNDEEQDKPTVFRQTPDQTLLGSSEVVINGDDIVIQHYRGYRIAVNQNGIEIESLDANVSIAAGKTKLLIDDSGIDIQGGKINLGGDFEVLYNKIPGVPIANVGQIGVSKKVKVR